MQRENDLFNRFLLNYIELSIIPEKVAQRLIKDKKQTLWFDDNLEHTLHTRKFGDINLRYFAKNIDFIKMLLQLYYEKARFPHSLNSSIIFKGVVKMKNPKEKLANIISFANSLVDTGYEYDEQALHPIIVLIKLLTDKIVFDNALELAETYKSPYDWYTIDMFLNHYKKEHHEKKVDATIEISLEKDPIISLPWEWGRLRNAIGKIGKGYVAGEWQQDESNHYFYTYLPICTTIMYNGLHSSFAGILKREGTLTSDEHNHIIDISALYDCIYFDGKYFRDIKTKKKLFKSISFEFGCIFEIGRIIKKANQKPCGKKIYYKGILL